MTLAHGPPISRSHPANEPSLPASLFGRPSLGNRVLDKERESVG